MHVLRTYLSRYLDGDRVAVWNELVSIGDRVFDASLIYDATSVAKEIVRRSKHNIASIHGKLVQLGYKFSHSETAFVLARSDAAERIREMEQRLGQIPLIAHLWYESFHSVDFRQDEEQLRGTTEPDVNGLGGNPAMIMQSLEAAWASWLETNSEHEKHCLESLGWKEKDPHYWELLNQPLKPFLATGGHASNCDPKGFELPCDRIDGVLYDDGGGPQGLVDQLRRCFEWGGFPFCKYFADGKRSLPWQATPNWAKVIPYLRADLLEI